MYSDQVSADPPLPCPEAVEVPPWRMVNPFLSSCELVSLATGICAPAVVKQQLLTAIDIGTLAMEDFVTTRLMAVSKNFFDPIPRDKLAGFGSLSKKVVRTVNKRAIVLKADKNLFARLAIVAQIRNLDMRNVLTYSLGPVPWALANPDGSLTKTRSYRYCISLKRTRHRWNRSLLVLQF